MEKRKAAQRKLTRTGFHRAGTIELHAIPVRLVGRGLPLLRCLRSPSHDDPLDRSRCSSRILSAPTLGNENETQNQGFPPEKVALEYCMVFMDPGDTKDEDPMTPRFEIRLLPLPFAVCNNLRGRPPHCILFSPTVPQARTNYAQQPSPQHSSSNPRVTPPERRQLRMEVFGQGITNASSEQSSEELKPVRRRSWLCRRLAHPRLPTSSTTTERGACPGGATQVKVGKGDIYGGRIDCPICIFFYLLEMLQL